ncbi:hypothetical protein FTX61_10515 [Nitriliruptoraceae bacterium ZYF776]|nr:hypothetical protein [Profundirhabdus halotolerans]
MRPATASVEHHLANGSRGRTDGVARPVERHLGASSRHVRPFAGLAGPFGRAVTPLTRGPLLRASGGSYRRSRERSATCRAPPWSGPA